VKRSGFTIGQATPMSLYSDNFARFPGGASTDWRPNLQTPDNPVPLLDMKKPPQVKSIGVD
jgi:hypothetical protein